MGPDKERLPRRAVIVTLVGEQPPLNVVVGFPDVRTGRGLLVQELTASAVERVEPSITRRFEFTLSACDMVATGKVSAVVVIKPLSSDGFLENPVVADVKEVFPDADVRVDEHGIVTVSVDCVFTFEAMTRIEFNARFSG